MKVIAEHMMGRHWGDLATTLKTPVVLTMPQHRIFIQDNRLLLKCIRAGMKIDRFRDISKHWAAHLDYNRKTL